MTKNAAKLTTIIILTVFLAIMLFSSCIFNKLKGDEESEKQGNVTESIENKDPTDSDLPNISPWPEITQTSENNTQEDVETTEETKPEQQEPPQKPEPVKAKALYLTGWTAGTSARLEHFIELANTTELNAFVIDIKDEDGYVGYKSDVAEVKKYDASMFKYNADKTLKALKDNNIYVIGRLVCFKDPVLSVKRPDLAVKTPDGELWKDYQKRTWLDPYNKESWPYIISIAKEAVEKGFDEIQFDYIRFPNDGDRSKMKFNDNGKKKYEIINEFLEYARSELPNVILSADIFGIVCESPEDTEDIGQYLELIGENVDYISPMVYPSHYAVGQIVNKVKFDKPDLEPYGVVYNTLVKANDRISEVEGYKAEIRPYLQDFTASWLGQGYYMKYGAEAVRKQISAVVDAGLEEWILWDAENTYSEDALKKE